jgi:hypothetical protein
MKLKQKSKLLLFVHILLLNKAITQQTVISPYSRYGLGEINQNTLTPYAGMGSGSVGLCDSFFVNPANPATYAFIIRHRPVFDVGTIGNYTQLKSNSATESSKTFAFKNLVLGLPIAQRWGLCIGLSPYSSTGYNVKYNDELPTLGTVRYEMLGNGGINRVFGGTSVAILNNNISRLSVGVNVSYLYGNLNFTRKAFMPASSGIYNTKIVNSRYVKGMMYDAGFFYHGKIKPRTNLIAGTTIQLPAQIKASQEMLAYTFINQNTEAVLDTVNYTLTDNGKILIPKNIAYALGFEFFSKTSKNTEKQSRLIITTQYKTMEWNKYYEEFEGLKTDSILKNGLSLSMGVQYTPFHNIANANYKLKIWEVSTYRMGLRYANSGLELNNHQITEYGISFGLSVPIFNSMSFSSLNFAIETGKRGTMKNNLIMENYVIYSIGISFIPHRNDVWFFKRKYD